ncbi:MAG: metallophosphoesterase, partial [Lentisphaeria bacterium]|nr:metallophosphoesterase [Lentisphaeria bacterium]
MSRINLFTSVFRINIVAVLLFLHVFLCACDGELARTAFNAYLEDLPEEHENIKIVFFADLHLRKETIKNPVFDELTEKVNQENAHFILIGGDLIDRSVEDYLPSFQSEILTFLQKIRSRHGIIYCSGNHENAAKADGLIELLKKRGIIYLEDTYFLPVVNGKILAFYGKKEIPVPKKEKGKKRKLPRWETFHLPAENLLRKDEILPENTPLLILSHRPELFDFLPGMANILLLSGHYHGGLVDLPFFPAKKLIYLRQKKNFPERPPLEYIYGKYKKGSKQLYVTSGISGGAHSA